MKKNFFAKSLITLFVSFALSSCDLTGPIGPQGTQGEQGVPGQTGQRGPAGSDGKNGEDGVSVLEIRKTSSNDLVDTYTIYYSNGTTSTFTVTNGRDGQSIQGEPGADGHTPVITIGTNGNWFIDGVDTGKPSKGADGLPGTDGATWLTGDADPSESDGKNGDLFLNTVTYDFFLKSSGHWSRTGNLKGANGSNGADGNDGSDGDDGLPGADGATWLTGDIDPTESDGKNGDLYFNTSSYDVFLKGAGIWNCVGNLKGEKGEDGNDGSDGHDADQYGKTYTVTLDPMGGTIVDSESSFTVDFGETVNLPLAEKEGSIFTGWYTGFTINDGQFTNSTPITKNVTLYAGWKAEVTRNICFHSNGGSNFGTVGYANNEEIRSLPTPQKTDYTFDGWYFDESLTEKVVFPFVITEDLDVYAAYVDAYYTVTFDTNGGSQISAKSYLAGSSVTILQEPTKQYKTFGGWYLNSSLTNAFTNGYKIHEDTTLYAKWNSTSSTIYFVTNGGSSVSSRNYENGTYVTSFPTSSKTNYSFAGWYTNEGLTNAAATPFLVTKDVTLYAKFNYNASGVFKFNGSEVSAFNTSISGVIEIPSSYKGNTITTIKSTAFNDCTNITGIVIPNTVTSIERGAFRGCSNLNSISLPFVGSKLDSNASFSHIFGYTSFTGAVKVTDQAQDNTTSLTDNYVPNTLRSVRITGTTAIPFKAFYRMSMLTSITFDSRVTSLGSNVFNGCSNITSLSLPYVSTIPSSTFSGCSRLTSFTIGSDVSSLGGYAFGGCSSLMSINSNVQGTFIIPNTVKSIESSAFWGCANVSSITVPFIGLNSSNDSSFSVIFGSSSYTGGTSVSGQVYNSSTSFSTYVVPSVLRSVRITNATKIPFRAFYNMSMLTSLYINSGAQANIGNAAFSGMTIQPTYF